MKKERREERGSPIPTRAHRKKKGVLKFVRNDLSPFSTWHSDF